MPGVCTFLWQPIAWHMPGCSPATQLMSFSSTKTEKPKQVTFWLVVKPLKYKTVFADCFCCCTVPSACSHMRLVYYPIVSAVVPGPTAPISLCPHFLQFQLGKNQHTRWQPEFTVGNEWERVFSSLYFLRFLNNSFPVGWSSDLLEVFQRSWNPDHEATDRLACTEEWSPWFMCCCIWFTNEILIGPESRSDCLDSSATWSLI